MLTHAQLKASLERQLNQVSPFWKMFANYEEVEMNAQLKLIDSKFKRGDKIELTTGTLHSFKFMKVDPELEVVWVLDLNAKFAHAARPSEIRLPAVPQAKPGVRYVHSKSGLQRIGMLSGKLGAATNYYTEIDFDPCVWKEV